MRVVGQRSVYLFGELQTFARLVKLSLREQAEGHVRAAGCDFSRVVRGREPRERALEISVGLRSASRAHHGLRHVVVEAREAVVVRRYRLLVNFLDARVERERLVGLAEGRLRRRVVEKDRRVLRAPRKAEPLKQFERAFRRGEALLRLAEYAPVSRQLAAQRSFGYGVVLARGCVGRLG